MSSQNAIDNETSGESPHRPEAVHCLHGLKKGLVQADIALGLKKDLVPADIALCQSTLGG